MRCLIRASLAVAVLLAGCRAAPPAAPADTTPATAAPAPAGAHPLDPLSADEIRVAVDTARSDPRLARAAFSLVNLVPPPKAEMLAWQPGQPVPRQARIDAVTPESTYEVLVDLSSRRLVSVVDRAGSEPALMASELATLSRVPEHGEFAAGLRKRGITDHAKVFCAPFTAGYYGNSARNGNRLVKVGCFDTRVSTTNLFGKPIEGLYALMDLRKGEIVSVTDAGVVPIADGQLNYSEDAVGELRARRKPTRLQQPEGANVAIDGHQVTWGQWRFHARVDPRVGTIISLARWQDGATARSVMYEGYLSEMFVPYMDPAYGWQSRTYFDTGEYGAGALATPLVSGIDCPATAAFLPAVFASDRGEPVTTPNALCVFERSGGDPAWRHAEALNQTYEGRANVELVVRMATTIGNYDYLIDWIFTDAAEIEVRLGATGIDALKGVASRSMRDATATADTRYGTLVAPNLVGVNHDHYFNFRLDLDVDGPANSINQDRYQRVALPPDSPRRSIYVVEPVIAATEAAARYGSHGPPAKLRVLNEDRTNGVGNPVSYEVLATNHAQLLLDPDDWPARRASYLQHDLWVTPNAPSERYAGGHYVVGGRGDDGLAAWSARDRPIRKQDIVLWVNIGMHHLPRAEDLPVMPTVWHSFRLRPHNFFDRNPAITLRNDAPAAATR